MMPIDDSVLESLATLRDTSMTSLLKERIEADIIAGVLKGGERLTETWLSARFNVSRGPIREALRTLEGQGFVEQRKNFGWFVRLLPPEEVREVFAVREMLDNGLADLLVQQPEDRVAQAVAELSARVAAMDEAIANNLPGDFAQLNQSFHDGLLALSRNERLAKLYRNMMGELASLVKAGLSGQAAMASSNADHRQMVAAVEQRDAPKLRELFTQHRAQTLSRMVSR